MGTRLQGLQFNSRINLPKRVVSRDATKIECALISFLECKDANGQHALDKRDPIAIIPCLHAFLYACYTTFIITSICQDHCHVLIIAIACQIMFLRLSLVITIAFIMIIFTLQKYLDICVIYVYVQAHGLHALSREVLIRGRRTGRPGGGRTLCDGRNFPAGH